MVITLAIALFIFYYFFVQSYFGIRHNRAKESTGNLIVATAVSHAYPENGLNTLLDFFKDRDDISKYTCVYDYQRTNVYNWGYTRKQIIEILAVSDENIQMFMPTVTEGKLEFQKEYAREKRRKIIEYEHDTIINGEHDVLGNIWTDTTDVFLKYGAIIPLSLSKHLFGENTSAIGKLILWKNTISNNWCSEKIICVYEDFPVTSNIPNNMYIYYKDGNIQAKYDIPSYVYAEMKYSKDTAFSRLEKDLASYNNRMYPLKKVYYNYDVHDPKNYNATEDDSVITYPESDEITVYRSKMQRDVDFNCYRYNSWQQIKNTDYAHWLDKDVPEIFLWLAVIVAFMGFICVFSLAIASIPMELKNISIRLVLGTYEKWIWMTMIGRYVTLSLTAFLLCMISIMFMSSYDNITQWTATSFTLEDNLEVVMVTFILTISVGVLIGVYTARYCVNTSMSMSIKANSGMDTISLRTRKLLMSITITIFNIVLMANLCLRPLHAGIYNSANMLHEYIYSKILENNFYIHTMNTGAFNRSAYMMSGCAIMLFVTILCMIYLDNRFMRRSKAIRCVLGTTRTQLMYQDLTRYLPKLNSSYIIATVIIYGFAITTGNSMNKHSIISMLEILVMNYIVITAPILLFYIFTKDTDITNALKTE